MRRPRLLVNECLSPTVAEALRREGHDAVYVPDIGLAGAADEVVYVQAQLEDRALVTLDKSRFGDARLYAHPPRPGVVVLRLRRASPDAALRELRPFLQGLLHHELRDSLFVLEDGGQVRREPLPVQRPDAPQTNNATSIDVV